MPLSAWLLLAEHPKIWGRLGKEGGISAMEGDETFAALEGCLGSCLPSLCISLPFSRRKEPGEAFSPGEKKYSN